MQRGLLLDIPHRFWTFSVPKRLRYYFLHNRKWLGLLVQAAVQTLSLSLSNGKLKQGIRPGIISLIQTHGDALHWNAHLHLIVTDGLVHYADPEKPAFHPCKFWNPHTMTELFRMLLIEALHKVGVLSPDVADNLLSWKHSGFHVHATAPFLPKDEEGKLLQNRMAYAFRPPVSLGRLSFDGKQITYRSRRETLHFSPVEFLARLILHIPDRYQNIRRYAGFYSSVVQRKVRLAKQTSLQQLPTIELRSPVKPNWAALIAKIFGTIPIQYPKCSALMNLREFILDAATILKLFPALSRAPPQKTLVRHIPGPFELAYGDMDDPDHFEWSQIHPEFDADFNQDPNR